MSEEPGYPEIAGKRVLVVNDTEEILELFEAILGEMGLEVISQTYTPRELERIHEVAPDLIILDLIFGEREVLGWQLLQKIRMDRRLEEVPAILCTAAVKEVEEMQGYLTEQNVIVVLKPFKVAQLEEAVLRVLGAEAQRPPSSRQLTDGR
jgi:putative two-component system response regulator